MLTFAVVVRSMLALAPLRGIRRRPQPERAQFRMSFAFELCPSSRDRHVLQFLLLVQHDGLRFLVDVDRQHLLLLGCRVIPGVYIFSR